MGEGIGWAVKQLQNGERVRRAGWNDKGMWLALIRPSDDLAPELTKLAGLDPAPVGRPSPRTLPFVVMYTATGELVPWLCSQTDLLAVDWEIASAQSAPDVNVRLAAAHARADQQQPAKRGPDGSVLFSGAPPPQGDAAPTEENAKSSVILSFMLNSIRSGGPEDPIELEDVVSLVGGTTLPIQRALKDGIEALEARVQTSARAG